MITFADIDPILRERAEWRNMIMGNLEEYWVWHPALGRW